MKPLIVHYQNKYPLGVVVHSPNSLLVIEGNRRKVYLERTHGGDWVDRSEEYGCDDRHDLSPLPRDTRAWKLAKEGKIEFDASGMGRLRIAKALHGKFGKVPNNVELLQFINPKLSVDECASITGDKGKWELLQSDQFQKRFELTSNDADDSLLLEDKTV